MIYDVIVIGMGPAGSTAAYEAASRGLSVLALDKSLFPRYKACGGGLTRKVHRIIDLESLACIESTITSFRLSYRSNHKTFHLDQPFAYMVMREKFDQMLVDRAVKTGVTFKGNTPVQKIDEQEDRVELYAGSHTFKGKVVIGADGALGMTTRWLNPHLKLKQSPGLEGEFKKDHDPVGSSTIDIEVGGVKSGYGWIFPKNKVLSIGVAGFNGNPKLKKSYHDYIAETFPETASCVKETGHPIPIFIHSRLKLVSRRLLLAGDAGRLVDPFFGEGIYYAMRSGQIAGGVAENFVKRKVSLNEYTKTIEKEFYPDRRNASTTQKKPRATPAR